MIRLELGKEVKAGIFEWSIPEFGAAGQSRQPMCDAARVIKRMGADPKNFLGMFRVGRSVADLTARVGVAAGLTVSEPNKGCARFVRWQEFDAGCFVEAAE